MSDPVMEEAVAWFACMHSDQRSRTDEDRYGLWLRQDVRHAQAYARVERVWQAAGPPIVPRSAVVGHVQEQARLDRRNRSRLLRGLAIAATLAALGIAGTFYFFDLGPISHGSFATATGAQRELKLSDGSIVTLNTRSHIGVDIDAVQRVVHLMNGEARFKVAKDAARPFVVDTGRAQVRALGTEFDVRVSEAQVAVTLVEGKVEVAAASSATARDRPLTLTPGEQVAIDVRNGKEKVERVSREHADAWLHHQLIFDAVPLEDAVGEANRYLAEPVAVGDASLAGIRVSGVVRAGSVESFVGALEASFPVRGVREKSGMVLVRRGDFDSGRQ